MPTAVHASVQVCPNSAKVRLNMGIMERRYQNWDAALGHFEAAAQLSTPGFCEPRYWIGITRINQGADVGRGIEVRPRAGPAKGRWKGGACLHQAVLVCIECCCVDMQCVPAAGSMPASRPDA